MRTLIFIPARGGSKGIKNKNLIRINKTPLIKFTIDFAKKFKQHKILMSSDSTKIISYCKKLKIKVNYKRPKHLATSRSGMRETVLDAINWLEKRKQFFDNVVILQPTNPLRKKSELDKMLKIFRDKKLESMASVTKMREHPFECVFSEKKKWRYLRKPKKRIIRRQDFKKEFFFIDGTYYLLDVKYLKQNKSFINLKKTYFFKLNHK